MNLRVLGCSGGIGAGLRTTSLLIDNDILIDAGSGVGELTVDEMKALRHIFLTHAHLDHVAFIPFLVDSIFEHIIDPIVIHAQPDTIDALKKNIFNWAMWPNFAELPTAHAPVLRYQPMLPGDVVDVAGRTFEMIEVNHVIPSVGYRVQGDQGAFAFSGDTTTNDGFWAALNAHKDLDLLIVEVAFTNAQQRLAGMAKHYCPKLLAADLLKLNHTPDIYLSHLKPGEETTILSECERAVNGRALKRLVGGEIFRL